MVLQRCRGLGKQQDNAANRISLWRTAPIHLRFLPSSSSHSAASSKNALTQVIEALWQKHGSNAAPNDGDASLAMQCACSSRNPGAAVASLVLAVGGNSAAANPSLRPMIDSVDPDNGLPAIFTACLRGSASAVEQLCYAGANVQHTDDSGRNLFHYLAQYMPKCHPHTVLVVAAASCGLPSRHQPGTKCVVVRAAHGHELFIPKGLNLRACCKKIRFFGFLIAAICRTSSSADLRLRSSRRHAFAHCRSTVEAVRSRLLSAPWYVRAARTCPVVVSP